MKNLILTSLLVVSLTASAQFIENRSFNFANAFNAGVTEISENISESIRNNIIEIIEDEEDAPFDFNINNYLPFDFNPISSVYMAYQTFFEFAEEEEDEEFEFNTKDYLPPYFDANYDAALMAEYEQINEESDESFDFDIKIYLPEDFNPYVTSFSKAELVILNEEEDEEFEFAVANYLPRNFNPYK